MILAAMKVSLAMGEPQLGLDIFDNYVPEVMHPPIRPYWVHSSKRIRNNRTSTANGEDTCVESNSDESVEFDDEEREGDDAGDDTNNVDDPSFSVDAMENGIRLKLLIMWGRLHRAAGTCCCYYVLY